MALRWANSEHFPPQPRIHTTRNRFRALEECRKVVQELDHQSLLDQSSEEPEVALEDIDDEELLSQLGVSAPSEGDVTQLRHVKPRAEIRAAEEIASRTRCEDFDKFKPIFEAAQTELEGARSGYIYGYTLIRL